MKFQYLGKTTDFCLISLFACVTFYSNAQINNLAHNAGFEDPSSVDDPTVAGLIDERKIKINKKTFKFDDVDVWEGRLKKNDQDGKHSADWFSIGFFKNDLNQNIQKFHIIANPQLTPVEGDAYMGMGTCELFMPVSIMAQDTLLQTDTVSPSKHRFSVEVGIHRSSSQSSFLTSPLDSDSKYLNSKLDITSIPCWGCTYYPTTGFQVNMLYNYKIGKFLSLGSGIALFQQRTHYTADSTASSTAVIKYLFWGDSAAAFVSRTYRKMLLEYDGYFLFAQVPIYFGYSGNRVSLFFGLRIPIAYYESAKKKYLIYSDVKRENTISWYLFSEYPWEFKGYYLITNRIHNFHLFIGGYFDGFHFKGLSNILYNFIEVGINIPFDEINKR